jgi:putative transposase
MRTKAAKRNVNRHHIFHMIADRLYRVVARIRAESELSCIDDRLLADVGLTRENYLSGALRSPTMSEYPDAGTGRAPVNWSGRRAVFSGILIPKEDGCMPRKRFTNEQIAFALRQAENGTPIEEICRKMGVSEPSFNRWKKQFSGMGVPEIRRLKQLEDENVFGERGIGL